jgi:thiamine-monophosphate kinase
MSRDLIEHALIDRLIAGLPRSPLQLNGPHESDAELIRLPGGPVLALTTDGVVEEVASGLYDDPYEIGWMTVTASASDLAAVGAEPLGLLVSVTLPVGADDALPTGLARGIGDAARVQQIPVLGGDTNHGERLQTVATAVGVISEGAVLTRQGCGVGDRLFVSGPMGLGSAFALRRLLSAVEQMSEHAFLPVARLMEGRSLRALAGCCIDTSDGLIAALDELMRQNAVGFRLTSPIECVLDARALGAAQAAGLPPWTMLAGPHGEYELLFTVPHRRRAAPIQQARAVGWEPQEIGEVTAGPGVTLELHGRRMQLDTGAVRNLFAAGGGNVEAFVAGLLRMDAELEGRLESQRSPA